MSFSLDGINNSNSTNPLIDSSVIFSAGDLADGDHQLIGTFDVQSEDDFVGVSHLECVAPLFHSVLSVFR